MARNLFQFSTENNPAWGDRKKNNNTDANWLNNFLKNNFNLAQENKKQRGMP